MLKKSQSSAEYDDDEEWWWWWWRVYGVVYRKGSRYRGLRRWRMVVVTQWTSIINMDGFMSGCRKHQIFGTPIVMEHRNVENDFLLILNRVNCITCFFFFFLWLTNYNNISHKKTFIVMTGFMWTCMISFSFLLKNFKISSYVLLQWKLRQT